jgi:hypothetical protein
MEAIEIEGRLKRLLADPWEIKVLSFGDLSGSQNGVFRVVVNLPRVQLSLEVSYDAAEGPPCSTIVHRVKAEYQKYVESLTCPFNVP